MFFTPVSRIAPTPSGYLHEGNAFNFIFTWLHVRSGNGSLRLRIDDMDTERSRPEYLDDVFRSLDWLGLDWDLGPFSVEEHERDFSQHGFMDLYREVLGTLKEKDLLLPCSCSRKELETQASYPGSCLQKGAENPPFAYRLKPLPKAPVPCLDETGSRSEKAVPEEMNYAVLQRKDGLPSYQLVSLVDDLRHGINFIVRGSDLLPSTLFQMHLSTCLKEEKFAQTRFIHHTLLKDRGEKLSKSKGAFALFQLKEKEKSPAALYRRFGKWMGWAEPVGSAKEALDRFSKS